MLKCIFLIELDAMKTFFKVLNEHYFEVFFKCSSTAVPPSDQE